MTAASVALKKLALRCGVSASLLAFGMACGGAGVRPWTPPSGRDRHDDPASLRPGYCSSVVHVWWPLAAPEVEALRGLGPAKAGDPHALLALAVLASSDHREAASYRSYQDNVDRFVGTLKPKVEAAADDWHRGYELHRAMHKMYFRSQQSELANYELNQSRITGIFETGRYNCISSAMLFTTLATAFGMPARGVVVPTHAFVELGPPGGKILEVETTSDTGFDLVHDERFYREAAASWSSSRGLAPVTLAQYRQRRILAPYQLMAQGMRNQASYAEEKERARLLEVAAFTDADNADAQRDRLTVYVNEALALHEKEAARTTVKLFDCVQPAIAEIASKWGADSKMMELVAWAGWYYADSLEVVGRPDEAVRIADSALEHVDGKWKDAAPLRQNYLSILTDRMVELMTAKDFARATTVHGKHLDACRSEPVCADNLKVVYINWSVDQQNAGDWQGARQALGDCIARLPGNRDCDAALKDLESRHRF